MRIKLDENLPRLARERIDREQWDVQDVHEESLAAALDAELVSACAREQRILITLDNDFADTRRYDPARSVGVVVLRPANQSIAAILSCLEAAIRALQSQPIAGTLWIVEPARLRIRDFSAEA